MLPMIAHLQLRREGGGTQTLLHGSPHRTRLLIISFDRTRSCSIIGAFELREQNGVRSDAKPERSERPLHTHTDTHPQQNRIVQVKCCIIQLGRGSFVIVRDLE